MPSLPGSSLGCGWLHFSVLLSVALFGLLLVGHLQNWPFRSDFLGHKWGNHRSLRTVSCLEDEYFNGESNTCHKCRLCPFGYKLNKACGNGLGEDATCSHCTSDHYQKDGECYPCKFCQGRETLEKCTNTSNTKCSSECSQGYFMAVNKQCIRIKSKANGALPQIIPKPILTKLSTQGPTTSDTTRALQTVSPSSNIKVQNGSDSKLPFEEHTTPAVNETDDTVSLWTFALVSCVFLVVLVAAGCALKGKFKFAAFLKAQKYHFCCCCKKNKQPKRGIELTDPENNLPVEGLEPQTSQSLLANGETSEQAPEEVVIIPDDEDVEDVFLPEIINEIPNGKANDSQIHRGGSDDSQMQNRGTDEQDEEKIRLKYAENVMFISRALTKENLDGLKSFLCFAISNIFTANDKETVDSFETIVWILQQRLVCSWSDTGILVNGLMSINRLDLAQKLEKSNKPEKNDQPRRLRRSSSRQD